MELSADHKTVPGTDPMAAGFLPLLRGSAQQEFDQLAIGKFGFPAFTLMENAGRGAAFIIEREFGPMRGRRIVVCCGSGNNGGDGYVVARTLYNQGAHVYAVSMKPPSASDAQKNFLCLQRLEASDPSGRLRLETGTDIQLPEADIYIDALFGVGLNRPLEGKVTDLVDRLNSVRFPVVSLDLPSGLHADTGEALGKAVHADLTITFSAYKPGLLFGHGSEYSGRIELVHIGLPLSAVLKESSLPVDWITTDKAVASALPSRDVQDHKYSAGMVLVIGGSSGLSGAPMLAARAAARVGAGYVACAVPEGIQHILATAMTEIPAIGLSECPDGSIDPDSALRALDPWLKKADALVIGPGLGKKSETQNFVRSVLQKSEVPVVVDADALPVAVEILNSSNQTNDWILTPHAGEFKRMTGDSDNSDRLASARYWSSRWNCTLVLKGYPAVIGHAPNGAVVCGRANPALATAGTGDVLAGLCGGLLAQGCPAPAAAICASHIGGLAADQYARDCHSGTMIAEDLCEGIVGAMTALRKK